MSAGKSTQSFRCKAGARLHLASVHCHTDASRLASLSLSPSIFRRPCLASQSALCLFCPSGLIEKHARACYHTHMYASCGNDGRITSVKTPERLHACTDVYAHLTGKAGERGGEVNVVMEGRGARGGRKETRGKGGDCGGGRGKEGKVGRLHKHGTNSESIPKQYSQRLTQSLESCLTLVRNKGTWQLVA